MQVRQEDTLQAFLPRDEQLLFQEHTFMPLMNSSFAPGECLKTVETMEKGSRQDIAWAEYYYFLGQPEKAIEKAECYLDSDDIGARLSACLICSYAYLHFSQDRQALAGLARIEHALHDMENES